MVVLILPQAIDGVGHEATKCDKQCGGQRAVHGRRQFTEVDVLAELQSYVETTAHETGEQCDGDALREVEVLDGFALLFFRESSRLALSGPSDDGNAEKGNSDTDEYRGGQLAESVLFGKERVDEYRSHDRAQPRTGTQGDGLSEGNTEVAHRQTKGQSAYAPKHPKEHCHGHMKAVGTCQQLYETMTRRHC